MATTQITIVWNAPSSAILTELIGNAGKAYGYQSTINGVPNPITLGQHITQILHDEVLATALQQKQSEAASAAVAAVNYSTVT